MLFFFDALPIDQSNIKHTKKLKEIPSRHFLENLPEKVSMYAFTYLKLIGNLQGISEKFQQNFGGPNFFLESQNCPNFKSCVGNEPPRSIFQPKKQPN